MLTDDRAQDDILDEIIVGSDDETRHLQKDDEDWDWEDPDRSCPRAYVGVPLREILAEAGTGEAEPAPEAWAAGFLPRDVPAAQPSPGPAGGFASGGPLDAAPPDPVLAAFADEVTGPDGRCAGASDDELIGLLRTWQRQESRAAARKLAVIAELIRRRPAPGSQPPAPGGMPRAWDKFCADELAAATACSGQAAEKTLTLAHDLATRLPGTAQALHNGIIDTYKARIIADATRVLDAVGAAAAEALVLPDIAGKTPGQIRAAIARAVIRVNPEAARDRREQAQKDARVELWREDAGTAALCGRDLPPAEVLAADQRITAYALELKAAGLEATMDQLRARAFLDFVLGTRSLPCADTPDADSAGTDHPGQDGARSAGPGSTDDPGPATPATDNVGTADSGDAHSGNAGNTSPGHSSPGGVPAAPGTAGFAARINLTIPLATLLGLAERPGEMTGLGALDPDLTRDLATAAAGNPLTTWCVTVTDQHGHPTAHGCARPAREPHNQQRTSRPGEGPPGRQPPGRRSSGGPPGGSTGNQDTPAFATEDGHRPPPGHGPPGGYGRWRLRTPGPAGRDYTIDIAPIPVTGCDHRDESAGYQPSDRLRHLIEIRDGECTWPPCRRAARRCDFEHAIPWDQGGRTCACNAGVRCRHHHHAKQALGWRLDQHLPGYHTWTTPSGRQYTTGPASYPI